ncbi:MAG: hypothetical protein B7Y26_02705 [Hydrogenophilales bacterium 16-64-46]|nr:MAG: hypothetical protein B7Z32_02405 [Hydrogenophilales bacterium 12-64-13]OYZ06724.1 MAG: hypothetical protein B7Y26_02705 [Hydrogenophilales bacterium 16-64-46]OZA39432.1 MAG: hypothetical protein B7X87_03810 [Hydrogenophilales bacterium 17-64-34]HQT00991.1 hypothetical protein [Thiobacillus sp.]
MMLRTLFTALMIVPMSLAWADTGNQADAATRFAQMLDMSSNANLARDSQQALDMMDAMTEPEFLVAAMAMSANPDVWLKAMEQAGSPNVPQNLTRMADPAMMTEWFYSSVDPQYQHAIVSRLLDPKKPQRWMQAMANPRFYMHALAVMNPATPMQWMKVTADGRMINPMQVWFDPKTYLNWMRLPQPVAGKKADKAAAPPAWKPPQRY